MMLMVHVEACPFMAGAAHLSNNTLQSDRRKAAAELCLMCCRLRRLK